MFRPPSRRLGPLAAQTGPMPAATLTGALRARPQTRQWDEPPAGPGAAVSVRISLAAGGGQCHDVVVTSTPARLVVDRTPRCSSTAAAFLGGSTTIIKPRRGPGPPPFPSPAPRARPAAGPGRGRRPRPRRAGARPRAPPARGPLPGRGSPGPLCRSSSWFPSFQESRLFAAGLAGLRRLLADALADLDRQGLTLA